MLHWFFNYYILLIHYSIAFLALIYDKVVFDGMINSEISIVKDNIIMMFKVVGLNLKHINSIMWTR